MLDNCYFTCTEAHVLTDGGRAALGRLLPAVGAFLGAAFAIRAPIIGRLNVTDRPCGFGGDVRVPPAVLADGVADADVVIFVTARPIPSDALAFAGHCQSDQGDTDPYVPMRPLVGHVNVDPAELGALDATAWADDERRVDGVLKVLLHETFHVLGFTYDKIRELPCPDAPSYDRYQPSTWEPRPCAAAGSRDPVAVHRVTTGGYAHDERRVHTPKVVEAARRHFDCAEAAEQAADPLYTCASGECIDGAALEDAGGEGTNGSHWEKRLFLGETMCGTTQDGETSAVSALTLALFEDAGWYRPDYDVAAPKCFFDASWCAAADGGREAREPLPVGRGAGLRLPRLVRRRRVGRRRLLVRGAGGGGVHRRPRGARLLHPRPVQRLARRLSPVRWPPRERRRSAHRGLLPDHRAVPRLGLPVPAARARQRAVGGGGGARRGPGARARCAVLRGGVAH